MSAHSEELSADARLRVMAARTIAQHRWPYVSSLLFSLKLVESRDLSTLAVDRGWRMYYSPTFVLREQPEALATVVLHEALHCLYEHAARFEALHQPASNHSLWNIAADIGINEVLDAERMPWTVLTPVRLKEFLKFGLTAELPTEGMYFRLLDYVETLSPEYLCGSVASGVAESYELPTSDADFPAIRTDHQQIVRDRVAQEVLSAEKGIGTVPAGLARWAQQRLSPTLPWRRILAGHIRRDLASIAGRRDYSYMRPSRRQEALKMVGSSVVLPAMRQPAPPRVAVVLDTSGSIARADLETFVAEVVGITRAAGVSTPVRVIPCDAVAYPSITVRSTRDIESMQLQGGGGTDMREGIEAATKLHPPADIAVVLTDGLTPWPISKPQSLISVIVGISCRRGTPAPVPEWCSRVDLSD